MKFEVSFLATPDRFRDVYEAIQSISGMTFVIESPKSQPEGEESYPMVMNVTVPTDKEWELGFALDSVRKKIGTDSRLSWREADLPVKSAVTADEQLTA